MTLKHLIVDCDDRAMPGLGDEATATFSQCRTYRYALTRRWKPNAPMAVFVMLNPSTAGASAADPTIRRCLGFARRWGAGGLLVLNAFALRSTDPKELYGHPDPVGPDNDAVITDTLTAQPGGRVVVAWGAHGQLNGRADRVTELIRASGATPACLGTTRDGHPRHPLYVRGDTHLQTYWSGEKDADAGLPTQ